MATTPNYSWIMPDPTDLVKDLPADFAIFGNAVDSTVKTNADAAINKTLIDAKGDLIVGSAADTAARLAVGGTNGHVLTVNSGATNGIEWAAVAAGGQTLISTTTLSAATSISLTSIPTTYKHLRLLFIDCFQSASDVFWTATLNNDTGSVYSYVSSSVRTNGTCVGLGADSLTSIGSSKYFAPIPTTYTTANNGGTNGFFDIYNYASTTLKRSFAYTMGGYSINGTLQIVNEEQ